MESWCRGVVVCGIIFRAKDRSLKFQLLSILGRLSKKILFKKRRLQMILCRKYVYPLCLMFLMVFMSSCNTTTPEFSTYEGVWRSLGSGTLLHIQGPNYQYYDVMHSSCLPRRSGPLSDFADDIQLELDTLK